MQKMRTNRDIWMAVSMWEDGQQGNQIKTTIRYDDIRMIVNH